MGVGGILSGFILWLWAASKDKQEKSVPPLTDRNSTRGKRAGNVV